MLRLCVVCWNDSLFEETGPKWRGEQREESARAEESRRSLAVWDKDWMDSLGVSNYTWAKVNKSERWCCLELFHPANSIPALSLMDSLCTQPSLSSNMSDMGWKSENVYLMLSLVLCNTESHIFIFDSGLQWSSCQWSSVQKTIDYSIFSPVFAAFLKKILGFSFWL